MQKLGLGGSCHWCTEAIFQSLKGVSQVQQGWLSTTTEPDVFYEGILLKFDKEINLQTLIKIHLHSHSSTSQHALRARYLSAVYCFNDKQLKQAQSIISLSQVEFNKPLLTQAVQFADFKSSRDEILNYYYQNPNKPFCQTRITPKLKQLLKTFPEQIAEDKKPWFQ